MSNQIVCHSLSVVLIRFFLRISERFGVDFSADLFYCLFEDTFCPKYCVRIFKPSAAPLRPKNGTSFNPLPFLDFNLFVWGKG